MPVPVASTHCNGIGLEAVKAEQLNTAGPFARLNNTKQQNSAAQQVQSPRQLTSPSREPYPEQHSNGLPSDQHAIATHNLCFTYPGIDGRPIPGARSVVRDMSIQLSPGSRCLLIGPNGAGKTSLLRILAGKYKVPEGSVQVLGQPPFYNTLLTTRWKLTDLVTLLNAILPFIWQGSYPDIQIVAYHCCSGDVAYIGGNWERDIAFAGYAVPLQGGFSAGQMIENVQGVSQARRDRLMTVLDVDPDWNMNKVSDGQRRRVQICMGLLRPFKVLLLDEVTVDLDVLGRADLMQFLRSECDTMNATIVYATHIFDGLEEWPTHLAYLANGKLQEFAPASAFPELQKGQLLSLVERWLRAEKAARHKRRAAMSENVTSATKAVLPQWNNGWAPGRLASSIKHASNTVMRM